MVSLLALIFSLACEGPDKKKVTFFEKGKALFEKGDFVKARLELKNSVQIDPEYTQGYYYLGLVEMSRQRVRPSLLSQLSDPCPYCTGTGKILSLETMSNKIERLVHRIANAYVGERYGQKNPARYQPDFAWRDLRLALTRWGIAHRWKRLWGRA